MESETWPRELYAWNGVDEALVVPNTDIETEPTDIFLPHSTIALREDDDENEDRGADCHNWA